MRVAEGEFVSSGKEQAIDHMDPSPKPSATQSLLWLPALLLTALGFIVNFAALRPGLMSYDSFTMYDQGVTFQFIDWHHPFLPLLMAFSRAVSGGTSLLLFFQLACLWTGLHLFAVSMRQQIGRWALLVIMIGYTPVMLNQSGFLGKTPLQTATFLLVFGVAYYCYETGRRPPRPVLAALLLVFFLGTVIRRYSYVSALPITMFAVFVFTRARSSRLIARSALGAVTILALFVVSEQIILYKVLKVERAYKSAQLFAYDLAGMMARSGRRYATRMLSPEFTSQEAIRKHFKRHHGMWQIAAIFGRDASHPYRNSSGKEDVAYLFREWRRAVVDDPLSYFKHRYHAVSYSLGFTNDVMGLRSEKPYLRAINQHGLRPPQGPAWRFFKRYNQWYEQTILFKPWMWFVLNILVSVLSGCLLFRKPLRRLVLPHAVLSLSGTLFYMIYLLVALDDDARFVYWGTMATALSAFGILATIISGSLPQRQACREHP